MISFAMILNPIVFDLLMKKANEKLEEYLKNCQSSNLIYMFWDEIKSIRELQNLEKFTLIVISHNIYKHNI